jgi:hypothetical protein
MGKVTRHMADPNLPQLPTNLHPQLASHLAALGDKNERQEMQLRALYKRVMQLAQQHADDQVAIRELRAAYKKAADRIRYIEDIPGKRVPYFLGFNIEIPGPDSPTETLRGARLPDVKQVSMDGPFVCTSYMTAFLMKTFSIGPYTIDNDPNTGRPNDPQAGIEVITPLSGRFRPCASTADPFSGAYIGAQVGPFNEAGASLVNTFRPGEIDFLFEVQDSGVDRLRQNQVPIPSRYLVTEFDRPLYLPVSDFFERGTTITFTATLTRDLGFAEVNYAQLPNGFAEGNQNPPPNPPLTGAVTSSRAVVSIGGTLYFTMVGYKILQAQSPGV